MVILPEPGETVIFQEMDEGAVLFCTREEFYFGLNSVGKAIWESLGDGVADFDELIRILAHRYPQVDGLVLKEDAAAFLRELEENKLVKARSPEPTDSGPR